MSTKTKTKEVSSQQQTNAPPSWTAPGLATTAGYVTDALEQVRNQPQYTGDFSATYDQDILNGVISAYLGAGAESWRMGDMFWQNSLKAKDAAPVYGGNGTFNPFSFNQGPAIAGIGDVLGGGAAGSNLGFTDAQMLARPDIAAMIPQLAASPMFKSWTPEAFQADDGGARLDAALGAATQPFVRELMNTILPGIRSSAIEAGAYTGDRAMSVLPTEAIAQTAGRANEVTQGLAYQGFQAEEDRRAQTWAQLQQLLGAQNAQENDFNLGVWNGTNDFNLGVFGTRAGAENDAYQIAQNAILQNNQQKNAWGLDRYRTDTDAALALEGMKQDQYQNWVSNMLQQGQLENQAFGLNTDRGNSAFDATLRSNEASRQAMLDSLMVKTASGDIGAQVLELLLGADQAKIDNELAKFQYGQEAPFAGLDVATQLLTALSGGWGTMNSNGTRTTTQSTSGLGPIIQGLAGLGMAAGSLGAFGGAGGLGAVTKFSPISSSIFGGGAKAGMSA